MRTIYLAEKSSQANDIASVIGIKKSNKFHIDLVNGDAITWARGHLLESLEPDDYSAEWAGRWSWQQLPMIPPQWKIRVVRGQGDRVQAIKALLKEADRVVIATDAGREGEMIARELLDYCKYKGKIERLWTSSLTAKDIATALKALRPNHETAPLYEAALGRSHADWLYGMTGSRGVTLSANVPRTAFPIGRVQTPTLALVVRRELAIRNFKISEYYELEATVAAKNNAYFKMWHSPDEQARITKLEQAQALAKQAERYTGPLTVEKIEGKESPPLPFSLPALQKEANKILGLSAKDTLAIAQQLYEKKATTYPRTDCAYLADSQKLDVPSILARLELLYPAAVTEVNKMGPVMRNTVFNDEKLSDHHGIVPTAEKVSLSGMELEVFKLVAQRYLQVLSADMLYEQTKLALSANNVPFKASGRVITREGWHGIKL